MWDMKNDLFSTGDADSNNGAASPPSNGGEPERQTPLADRMRPVSLDEVVGQEELLGPGGPLRLLLEGDSLPSMLLWMFFTVRY